MQYSYINYSKYNIDNICEAYENENIEDFFRICKMLKFTINPYPREHKYAKEVKQLDTWLAERCTFQEKRMWKKILEESNYINMLYNDLYSDPQYEVANTIESSKELSAFLICTEYILRALLDSSVGDDYLSEQLGLKPDFKEYIEDINNRIRFYGELFDNISIKITDVLEYLYFVKKNSSVCENVDIGDIENARGHVLSILKKTCIDMAVESWQFGDLDISLKENIITMNNDSWGHIIRLYWEIRERSNTTTWVLASEECPKGLNYEQREIEVAKFVLEKQLYVSDLNYQFKIFKGNKIVDIFDLVKGYARLKSICQKFLEGQNNKYIIGDITEVCVRIKKEDIENQFQNIGIKDSKQIIELLIYKKNRDIIDSPLIASGNMFYMIPTLVLSANISEIVLSMANTFEFRGKELEKQLLVLLKEENICCGKLKIYEKADTYEYDSLFVIDNSLFIVESKAWGFPKNITQYYLMNDKILKADEQIRRLEKYVSENLLVVLETLNLPNDYRIENVYRIILTNFQRADHQALENTFLCGYNSFRGFIKDISSGILIRNSDKSVEKIYCGTKRKSNITSNEMIDFLQSNNELDICSSLLDEELFYEAINKLYIQKKILKRKVGLVALESQLEN